jgi:NSS family neurotransmitter:Na+ symporter
LVFAGLTSLVSVIEVVISAVRDKFELTRVGATLLVGIPAAVISLAFFSTTSGVYVLDIVDHFINRFGILAAAVVSMLVLAWVARAVPDLARHMNIYGSIRLGRLWVVVVSVVTPLALGIVLVQEFVADVQTPYGDYPTWMLVVFGWGAVVGVALFGLIAARIRWRDQTPLVPPPEPVPAAEGPRP